MRALLEWELAFIRAHRVARLATVDARGWPHVVPIVYVFDGTRLFTPVDGKPKRVGVQQLQRVRNLRENPHVSLVIDDYAEDWQRLAWVQIRGSAEIADSGPLYMTGAAELQRKYPQYQTFPIALVIGITPSHFTSWRARGPSGL